VIRGDNNYLEVFSGSCRMPIPAKRTAYRGLRKITVSVFAEIVSVPVSAPCKLPSSGSRLPSENQRSHPPGTMHRS